MSVRHRARPWVLCALTVTGVAVLAQSQGRIIDGTLAAKKAFADRQLAALAVPFTGVRTAAGVTPGLFPVRATGVSTEPIRLAADAFLASLTGTQAIRTVFAVDDAEWRRWSNVDNGIYVRHGVSLKEMTEAQRQAAVALMRASLSAKGLALTDAIRKTDQTLREINGDPVSYDEQLYFFTMMGMPSRTEPWGWQIDGHHLVINYFVLGDQVVMTPCSWAASLWWRQPASTRATRYCKWSRTRASRSCGRSARRSRRRPPCEKTSPPTTSRLRPTRTTWSSTTRA